MGMGSDFRDSETGKSAWFKNSNCYQYQISSVDEYFNSE